MHDVKPTPEHEKLTWFKCLILILSIYVLIVVFTQTVFHLSPATNLLLDYIDSLVCLVFLFDFFIRLYKAPSKTAFLKWGWIDFISSIPMAGVFRWGRLFRIIRIFRILRAFRSSKVLISYLFHQRAKSTFAAVTLMSVVLMIFSSILMLYVETDANSNIKTPADALWWAFATVTTVGYGDKYPITPEGRMVAVILMIAGVGLFATFTAYIANVFMESIYRRETKDIRELIHEVKLLREKIEARDPVATQPSTNVPSGTIENSPTL